MVTHPVTSSTATGYSTTKLRNALSSSSTPILSPSRLTAPSSSSPIDTEVNHPEGPHPSFTVALHRLRLLPPPTNIANSTRIDAGHPSTPRRLSRTIHSTDTGLRCQDFDIKFCHRLSSRGCWAPCYIATRTNTLRTYNSIA